MERGHLLGDLRRALGLFRPDAAEDLLREIELRLAGRDASRPPVVPRGRLFDEVAPALEEAFPDRAARLLLGVQEALWPHGVIGPVSVLRQAGAPAVDWLDVERDSFPSFLLADGSSTELVGVRLLLHRDSMILGRDARSDFHLGDPTLSREHLRITLDAREQVFVEDLGSSG
ncbi:MAG TPA: FHA domain-containing protein, partial [bacterium]|nr:FHA domain-containing protein [bacterium]